MKLISEIPPELEDKENFTPDFHPKSCLSTIAICIVLWVLIFFAVKCNAQTIAIGYGYTSAGITTAKLSVRDIHNLGFYVRHTNQELDDPDNCGLPGPVGSEINELVAGISYRIHHQVSLQAGAGQYLSRYYYNTTDGQRCHDETKMLLAEAGFIYDLVSWRWGSLSLSASLNTITAVNSILSLEINLPGHETH